MTRTQPASRGAYATPFAVVAWLALTAPALAVFPPPIKDDGKFFSKEAVEKANKKIKDIYQKYKKDVVIETLAELTEEQQKKLKDESKTKFFGSLADTRAKELGVNGLYVQVCKKPQHILLHADPDSQKKIFTSTVRKEILEKFTKQFRDGKFDVGLQDALDKIVASLEASSK